MLESTSVPEQQVLVEFIRRGITSLNISSVKIVQVYGRHTGEEFPAWSQEFTLAEELLPSSNSSEIKLTNSPTKKQSPDKSSEYYQSTSGKKQYDPKVVILSALWNFCKWYISGFTGKSYEETYVSSIFIRSCHQGLRMFFNIIFIILGFIILGLIVKQNNISFPAASSVSSSSGSVSESSSIPSSVPDDVNKFECTTLANATNATTSSKPARVDAILSIKYTDNKLVQLVKEYAAALTVEELAFQHYKTTGFASWKEQTYNDANKQSIEKLKEIEQYCNQ
ncbi:hypothetical protein FD723_05665 [Nostoc sp. C052]|uniref:hypothetical protein n=1 Tax=Nostoc sp. C052 TaxID=2576902 RepID=UPI0015C2F1D4|nr:hypothetical protein [Nostoc sp. C052]QLE39999.1 hypothetical protein FD723_05665 [Nostoc sp. C052]